MKLPVIILASASPRRAELLLKLGVEFVVVASDVPEVQPEQLTVREICQINAYRKARAVSKQHPDALVLGADTLVALGDRILGKPRDLAEAGAMLAQLEGRRHEVVTGVCLLHLRGYRSRIFAEGTQVTFRRLDAGQISRYLASIQPLDKAGAYAIQEHGDQIIEGISGSYSNVAGLPVERLRGELEAWSRG